MKLCSRNTASGSAKTLCDNQSDQYDPPRPRSRNIVTKGRRAIWSRTICSANTATNNALRNGKSIHAKAYAASDARRGQEHRWDDDDEAVDEEVRQRRLALGALEHLLVIVHREAGPPGVPPTRWTGCPSARGRT